MKALTPGVGPSQNTLDFNYITLLYLGGEGNQQPNGEERQWCLSP